MAIDTDRIDWLQAHHIEITSFLPWKLAPGVWYVKQFLRGDNVTIATTWSAPTLREAIDKAITGQRSTAHFISELEQTDEPKQKGGSV